MNEGERRIGNFAGPGTYLVPITYPGTYLGGGVWRPRGQARREAEGSVNEGECRIGNFAGPGTYPGTYPYLTYLVPIATHPAQRTVSHKSILTCALLPLSSMPVLSFYRAGQHPLESVRSVGACLGRSDGRGAWSSFLGGSINQQREEAREL